MTSCTNEEVRTMHQIKERKKVYQRTLDLILSLGAFAIESRIESKVTSSWRENTLIPASVDRVHGTYLQSVDGLHIDVNKDIQQLLAVGPGNDGCDLQEGWK